MWFHGHACPCIRCIPEPNAAAQAELLLLRLCVLTPPSGTIDTPIPMSACPTTATARGTPEYPCHFPMMANGYAALSSHVCVAPPCRATSFRCLPFPNIPTWWPEHVLSQQLCTRTTIKGYKPVHALGTSWHQHVVAQVVLFTHLSNATTLKYECVFICLPGPSDATRHLRCTCLHANHLLELPHSAWARLFMHLPFPSNAMWPKQAYLCSSLLGLSSVT